MHTNTSKLTIRLFLSICLWCLLYSSNAHAQFSVSERTYKKLENVEKYIEQKDYKKALETLEELQASSVNKKYELTLVYLARGHVFYETSRLPQAIDAFEQGLSLHAAPPPVIQNIRLNLIQAYAASSNYPKAIDQFSMWLDKESTPSADVLALGGSLYAFVKQYDKAIIYLKHAIATTTRVNESWYRTLLSVYFENQDYTAATQLLKTLVASYPDTKLYWIQLFSSYYLVNDYNNALAILEMVYTKHFLATESDLTNLVRLYLYLGIPAKAITVLNTELHRHQLENNENNLQLLANAYFQSRQWREAAQTYRQLATVSHNQEYNLTAAQLFTQTQQWQSVIDTLSQTNKAIDNGQLYILSGRALIELHESDKAMQAFTKAKAFSTTRTEAEQWISYLQTLALIKKTAD